MIILPSHEILRYLDKGYFAQWCAYLTIPAGITIPATFRLDLRPGRVWLVFEINLGATSAPHKVEISLRTESGPIIEDWPIRESTLVINTPFIAREFIELEMLNVSDPEDHVWVDVTLTYFATWEKYLAELRGAV